MSNVITGPGIKIYANGTLVGFATAISFTRTQNVAPIMEIDNPYAVELRPTSYSVTGSLAGIRVRQINGLDDTNFNLMNLANTQDFFNQKYVKLEVVDRVTGYTLYTISTAMFSQDSWQVSSRSQMTFQANFVGIFLANTGTSS